MQMTLYHGHAITPASKLKPHVSVYSNFNYTLILPLVLRLALSVVGASVLTACVCMCSRERERVCVCVCLCVYATIIPVTHHQDWLSLGWSLLSVNTRQLPVSIPPLKPSD